MPHHAMDDGRCLAHAFDGKLLHLLIDPCGQLAKFIHVRGLCSLEQGGDLRQHFFHERCRQREYMI
jgi:hypothetical protein